MLQYFKGLNEFKSINFHKLFMKKEKTNLLCIDIGSSSIKIAEVGKCNDKLILDKYFILPLPQGAVESHQIKDRALVKAILEKFVKENNYSNHDTALVISGPQVVTQVLNVPAEFADNQLSTHINLEASKYLPFDIEELALDYDVLESGADENGNLQVLLAAAKKDYVNELISLMQEVGLNLRVIDVYSCVMGRLSKHVAMNDFKDAKQEQNSVLAIVDIGLEFLTLTVFDQDRQIYLKEQAFGSKVLCQEVMSLLQVDYTEAQNLIVEAKDNLVLDAISNFNEKASTQIFHMLQFFYVSAFACEIDAIFVTGGVARQPGLVDAIGQKSSLKSYYLDPFNLISKGTLNSDDTSSLMLPCLTPVCGLAIRSYVE